MALAPVAVAGLTSDMVASVSAREKSSRLLADMRELTDGSEVDGEAASIRGNLIGGPPCCTPTTGDGLKPSGGDI